MLGGQQAIDLSPTHPLVPAVPTASHAPDLHTHHPASRRPLGHPRPVTRLTHCPSLYSPLLPSS